MHPIRLIFSALRRGRTYENYWRRQLGATVRIKRGALEGRRGRLTALCSETYGLVFLQEGNEPCIVYTDLEVTAAN
jgi:hypothetical protein